MDKRAFVKTVTKIRKALGTTDYPKAMMTGAQQAKGTATINCDCHRKEMDPMAMQDLLFTDPLLLELLADQGATAHKEMSKDGFPQIRINY